MVSASPCASAVEGEPHPKMSVSGWWNWTLRIDKMCVSWPDSRRVKKNKCMCPIKKVRNLLNMFMLGVNGHATLPSHVTLPLPFLFLFVCIFCVCGRNDCKGQPSFPFFNLELYSSYSFDLSLMITVYNSNATDFHCGAILYQSPPNKGDLNLIKCESFLYR